MKITTSKKINSLYIHIPFCHHICFYCDFPKVVKNDVFVSKYLDSLINELDNLKINHKLKTIYIGGGTPSCVDLTPLLIKLNKYIDKDTEFSIEANVLDINEKILKTYKKYHINRISLGVQAMDNNLLKVLSREHKKIDVINKIKLMKKYIKNINVDLIYGFNELNNTSLKKELNEYIALDVPHISTYSLEINPGTKFFIDKKKPLDTSKVREQFDIIYKFLTKNGYSRYEISNFAKRSKEAKHNITYWKDNEYYGIGLGAASYINDYRYKNTLNLKDYINHKYIVEKEKISKEDDKKYYLMLNLRLKEGIDLKDYKKRFNEDLLESKKEEINKLIKRKLLKIVYTNLVATYEGSMLLDIILKELF